MPKLGDRVHFRDSRNVCMPAFVVGTGQVGVKVDETPEGKPIYKQVPSVIVEIIDNGGRYNRTLMHRGDAPPRCDSYHVEGECDR